MLACPISRSSPLLSSGLSQISLTLLTSTSCRSDAAAISKWTRVASSSLTPSHGLTWPLAPLHSWWQRSPMASLQCGPLASPPTLQVVLSGPAQLKNRPNRLCLGRWQTWGRLMRHGLGGTTCHVGPTHMKPCLAWACAWPNQADSWTSIDQPRKRGGYFHFFWDEEVTSLWQSSTSLHQWNYYYFTLAPRAALLVELKLF